jgi:hypothetical protein
MLPEPVIEIPVVPVVQEEPEDHDSIFSLSEEEKTLAILKETIAYISVLQNLVQAKNQA